MSPQKKRLLKLLGLAYVGLVILFFVYTAMVTKGEGIRRTLTDGLVGPDTVLTEPLELDAIEGTAATQKVVDALTSAGVTVISVAGPDGKAVKDTVGTNLVQRQVKFHDASLPAGTRLTEALWKEILRSEVALRKAENEEAIRVYVKGAGGIIAFDATLVFVVINFLGLLVILYLLLWDPILKMLDDRAASIKGDLENAAKAREDAASLKGKYQQLLIGSKQERQELIAEGRKEGQAERQRIVDAARQEADKVIDRTRQELEAAAEKVRRDLVREIGGLSIELARKVLAREVREADNRQLVEDFLAKLNQVESSS